MLCVPVADGICVYLRNGSLQRNMQFLLITHLNMKFKKCFEKKMYFGADLIKREFNILAVLDDTQLFNGDMVRLPDEYSDKFVQRDNSESTDLSNKIYSRYRRQGRYG